MPPPSPPPPDEYLSAHTSDDLSQRSPLFDRLPHLRPSIPGWELRTFSPGYPEGRHMSILAGIRYLVQIVPGGVVFGEGGGVYFVKGARPATLAILDVSADSLGRAILKACHVVADQQEEPL